LAEVSALGLHERVFGMEARFPKAYERDVEQAVEILKAGGCTQVFLFGSLASGEVRRGADIDLAVRGCPRGDFFYLLGRLLLELEHSVDLVSLDRDDPFARYLEEEGELLRIA
jgi:predicted nucleotidyltransferase